MKSSMKRSFGLALLVLLTAGGLAACDQDGPAEQAGENVDEAMDDASDSVEEMGDDMESAADDATN
ncbi:hypothetical protein ACUN9Y_05965 [Halomonas sp. V046]|uniref:hypothetical protein n=1 Tax=Halomonas sp. V046 TaxID=3459611 RepID=UPI004044DD25